MAEIESILAVGSMLSGIGAVITALIVYLKMKESNKITRDALKETKRFNQLELVKNKPNLILEHASYILDRGQICLSADLLNSGQTGAKNIKYRFIVSNQFFGSEIINDKKLLKGIDFPDSIGSLNPDTQMDLGPVEIFENNTGVICMALWFKYDYFDVKDYEEIKFLVFEKGRTPHVEFSIDNDEIKEIKLKK